MIQKRLSYYNYFLILSIFLIVGYFITSLFFITKTSDYGEQAYTYAKITEQTDEILNKAFQMEAFALSFILTNNEDYHAKYKESRCVFHYSFNELKEHCSSLNLAERHVQKLEELINKRSDQIHVLVKQDSSSESKHDQIDQGAFLMGEIKDVLNGIRSESAEFRDLKKDEAIESTYNVLFMLSVFGVVMLVIVIISFSKMKSGILMNEAKTLKISQINKELKLVNENLENFAYVASHDLNEPLRKIRAFGDLVHEEMEHENYDEATIKNHIERMQNASKRMQLLIDDLLSYSRIHAQPKDFRPINLSEIIAEVENDLQLSIKEKDAAIKKVNLPNDVEADPIQMRQLFQNLLSNALRFSRDNVKPKIEISAVEIGVEDVPEELQRVSSQNKFYKIQVVDNGIGFDNQFREKIFVVFQRLHGRTAYEGTGIGLSICKKIVDQHNGLIKADGEEGKGAVFTIYLPKSQLKNE